MDRDPSADGGRSDHEDNDQTTESILEALLVEDAEIAWDPVTGKPRVTRRTNIVLDTPPDST